MRNIIWIGLIISFLGVACESEEEKAALVEQRLQEEAERRVAEYTKVLQNNCDKKVLEEAVRIADSILVLEARLSTDTLLKPLKPTRPDKPETLILQDTTPVKPFLKPQPDTTRR